MRRPPSVLFEDEHLLVVNKPSGINTHSPAPFAGEGIYDWLRNREPAWANLAMVHRLDKETSGVMVFSKTPLANRSLTGQFTEGTIRKLYLLLTDRPVPQRELSFKTCLVRAGEKYISRPLHAGGEVAETVFRPVKGGSKDTQEPLTCTTPADRRGLSLSPSEGERARERGPFCSPSHGPLNIELMEAEPRTGRTHQIRVHAASASFPILGDILYGGSPAQRLCLHASRLILKHPASGREMTFQAPDPEWLSMNRRLGEDWRRFSLSPSEGERAGVRGPFFRLSSWSQSMRSREWRLSRKGDNRNQLRTNLPLRQAIITPEETSAFRVVHGASDGCPGWYVDRLGDWLLSQADGPMSEAQKDSATQLMRALGCRGVYHKALIRDAGRRGLRESSPTHVSGDAAPEKFLLRENDLEFEVSLAEGYSAGLFLDQRDNRRRLLTRHVAAGFELTAVTSPGARGSALNTFAYTCGFSVCAARAGMKTTSVDLSRKYLDWGKRNFAQNGIDHSEHEFFCGDTFDWMKRLARKHRTFDLVLLDPPTFSRSKEFGPFQVRKDYGKLVREAMRLLARGGILFASTNAVDWKPEEFLETVRAAIADAGRTISQMHYVPQPPDFPITRSEPAHLKTVWLRIA